MCVLDVCVIGRWQGECVFLMCVSLGLWEVAGKMCILDVCVIGRWQEECVFLMCVSLGGGRKNVCS